MGRRSATAHLKKKEKKERKGSTSRAIENCTDVVTTTNITQYWTTFNDTKLWEHSLRGADADLKSPGGSEERERKGQKRGVEGEIRV